MSTGPTADLIAALLASRVYRLAQPLYTGIPCSPNHPGFRSSLSRRHGDSMHADGGSTANELIVMGGHVGTHIDALAHVSHDGLLHGGKSAAEALVGGRFASEGIDELGALVARGVLLDIAGLEPDRDRLGAAYPIGPDELNAAARAARVELAPGDVTLVRTGWAQLWDDPTAFLGHASGVPGVTEDGARWLARRGIRAAGSDTAAFEHIPPGKGHALLPAHRVLLVESGIHIIEMLDLEELARDGATVFAFVLAPLPILGGTGSPVTPIALVR